jgi:hypothetical protein
VGAALQIADHPERLGVPERLSREPRCRKAVLAIADKQATGLEWRVREAKTLTDFGKALRSTGLQQLWTAQRDLADSGIDIRDAARPDSNGFFLGPETYPL